jgi:nucleoid DNA-binding protein
MPTAPAPRPGASAEADREEVARILRMSLADGQITANDKTYVAQLIAAETGLNQAEAERRIDEVIGKALKKKDKVSLVGFGTFLVRERAARQGRNPKTGATIKIKASKTRKAESGDGRVKEHLVLTRYNPARVAKGEMLSVDDVKEILAIPLLGVVPESQAVLTSSNAGTPVIVDKASDAGLAYDDVVARFLGEERAHRFLTAEKKGLLGRLFGP